jgi:hypothetical protein
MKTYTLIMLPEPIIISDEEIKQGDWYYTKPFTNLSIRQCIDNSYSFEHCKKIIAGIPELPQIDFSSLSEEKCKEIGYVNVVKMVKELYPFDSVGFPTTSLSERIAFKRGFKACQSLNEKRYSEEDMRKAFNANELRKEESYNGGEDYEDVPMYDSFEEFIKSLQPKSFQVEIDEEECVETSRGILVNPQSVIGAPYDFKRPKLTKEGKIKVIKVL